ncbi:MAG: hypothetical protein QM765_09605 [Myxococcales bacterium]
MKSFNWHGRDHDLQSHFHVGSLPQIVKVEIYEKGGYLSGSILFSEPLAADGLQKSVCPHALKAPADCWSFEVQTESNEGVWIHVPGTTKDELAVSVTPGAKAVSGQPLRDAQGNETFVITLGAMEPVAPYARTWCQ